MQRELLDNVNEYKKNNRKKSAWRKVVQGLACCVVFCTTYALILPAVTMKQDTFCGHEEHMHTQECYVQDELAAVLICPLEEGAYVLPDGTVVVEVPAVEATEAPIVEATEVPVVEATAEPAATPAPTPHVHTSVCYATPEEYSLTCGLDESTGHTHDSLCYGNWRLVCEKDEHSHSLICFSNPNADVENTVVWDQMMASLALTGEWSEDVVAIAKNQVGYSESLLNYNVWEGGSLSGYTRYGAWNGAPYEEWNATFANFCISYAGVESMPLYSDCQEWKAALESTGLYGDVQKYTPQAGSLLFGDENGDGLADRVGIVTEFTAATEEAPAQIKTIQGNVDNQVQYVIYEANDTRILGYGLLPKQPAPMYSYADKTVQVSVQLSDSTQVPRNAQLVVSPIGQENPAYTEMLQQAETVVEGEVAQIQFYDISFCDKHGTYIPVEDWAQVTMSFTGVTVESMDETVVLHYDENKSEPEVVDTMASLPDTITSITTGNTEADAESITFVTHGFSVFAVVNTQVGNTSGNTEYITNLDDLILAIIAVNNEIDSAAGDTEIKYPALASTFGSGNTLIGSEVASAAVTDGSLTISDENDEGNQLAWKFDSTGSPGNYYIQAVNYYGETNSNAGKYLNISSTGFSLSDSRQAIEVIRATTDDADPVKNNVVCLRANVGGTYYTIQLNDNIGSGDFVSSGTVQDNPQASDNAANHFVLASPLDSAAQDFVTNIDQLPTTENFDNVVDQRDPFTEETAYREYLRDIALEAAAYYNSVDSVELNFIGKERIDKFMSLEWLWRKDPDVVTADTPSVIIKLFNYTEEINTHYFDNGNSKRLGFYSYDPNDKTVDENRTSTNGEAWSPDMDPMLSANGYPVIDRIPVNGQWNDVNNGELAYLFDENSDYHQATMQEGGGLFQKDEDGFYYYFSDMNAAWYNSEANRFVLYDVAVRPEYARLKYNPANGTAYDSRSNFLPFNEVVGNIIYDDPALRNGDDEDTVKTRYDGHTDITTQTAYLNSPTDLWFGMTMEYNFFIPTDATIVNTTTGEEEDMVFEFHGDDDVFVYIDDVLILDIGGVHEARDGSINFKTGAVYYETDDGSHNNISGVNTNLRQLYTSAMQSKGIPVDESIFDGNTLADNSMHNLKFFYIERGGTYSYAGIKFNMPTIPENSLMVGKDRLNDDSIIDARAGYSFRIVNADNPSELYVAPNTNYLLYEDGELIGTQRVGADGIFVLKANQKALFAALLDTERAEKEYIVQELIPENIDGQYMVSYSDDKSANNVITTAPTENGMVVYSSAVYHVDENEPNYTKNVIFKNEVVTGNLDTLKITKLAGDGVSIDANEIFDMYVQVASDPDATLIPVPVGTKYTIGGVEQSVTTAGIIPLKVDETVVITGFLSGTYWIVEERDTAGYSPEYSGEAVYGQILGDGNEGIFGLGDTVEFTVTNYEDSTRWSIPISKQALNNFSRHTFEFVAELGTWNYSNNTFTSTKELGVGRITVTNSEVVSGSIPIRVEDLGSGGQFIRVRELKGDGNYIYDTDFYILQISTYESNGNRVAQITNGFMNNSNGGNQMSSPYISSFVNEKITGLTVEKEVINSSDSSDLSGEFSFEATVTVNGSPYTEITAAEDGSYTVDNENGTVQFTLQHGESVTIPLPNGAVVTVTEEEILGYTTSHQVTQAGQVPGEVIRGTATGNITVGQGGTTVHYINRTGYELPNTGGSGTAIYLFGGLLAVVAFGGLMLIRMRRKTSQVL